jgi:hypothetical protein
LRPIDSAAASAPSQHFETLRGLVDDQIDDLRGFAEMLDERHDVRIKAAE